MKGLNEEQRQGKSSLYIYDSNNGRKFIERIKRLNHRMHAQHRKNFESPQGSGRLAPFHRHAEALNRSAESMVDLRNHRRNDSIVNHERHRHRGPHSNGGDHEASTYTLGGGSIKAGNYTIDVIKRNSPPQSQLESAKFISEPLAHQPAPLMLPQNPMTLGSLLGSMEDPTRKKTVEITLAPDLID